MKSRQKPILLDIGVCESLAMLMNSGFSFRDSLNVLEDSRLKNTFSLIRKNLQEGNDMAAFLPDLCVREIRGYLAGFLRYMTVSAAFAASCSIARQEKKHREMLVKGCLYPCMLCGGMLVGIFLFATFVLPAMLSLMSGLGIEGSETYEWLRVVIRFFTCTAAIVLSAGGIFLAYRLRPSKISATYRFAAVHFHDSFPVISASLDFTRFFLECIRMNVPTIQALKMLSTMKEKPLVALIADELDCSLCQGQDLVEAMDTPYVETALKRFIRIAVHSSECEKMLEGYLEMVEKRTQQKIRRFSRTVQLFSYTLIGIVLIFVYRILMMPMIMLQKI